MSEAKIRLLHKYLDTATRRIRELNREWISTIEGVLDATTDLQKLASENRVPNSADTDINKINRTVLEQVKAREEILYKFLQTDDFQRVMKEVSCE